MRSTMPHVPLTVPSLVDAGWVRAPGTPMVFSDAGQDVVVPAGEVHARSRRLGAGLAALGVGVGDVVATFLWNTREHLEAYAAVPSIGAVLLTVNVRLAPEEIAYILEHARARVLVADRGLGEVVAHVLARLEDAPAVVWVGNGSHDLGGMDLEELLDDVEPLASWRAVSEDAPAAMCYTSGTTGRPKGVVYSHRSTFLHSMSVCSGNAVAMSHRDTTLILVPMYHANAWGWPYAAMLSGARLVLPGRDLSPAAVAGLIERHGVTLTGGVPTLWADMLKEHREQPRELSSLRMILCGGSAVPPALVDVYEQELGVPIVQAWGMTEMSPLGAVAWPPPDVSESQAQRHRISQGRLLGGVDARVVDDDGRVLAHDGSTTGELQVRGPWITTAYHGGEGADAFDGPWLRTGDVGAIDERGYLWITDRAKDVIKSGGEWISSVELEHAIAEDEDVDDAMVIAVPDERWGERPLAVIVGVEGRDVDPNAIRSRLSGRVPRWWEPERWLVVPHLPRTSIGKLDKKHMRQRFLDGELETATEAPDAR